LISIYERDTDPLRIDNIDCHHAAIEDNDVWVAVAVLTHGCETSGNIRRPIQMVAAHEHGLGEELGAWGIDVSIAARSVNPGGSAVQVLLIWYGRL